MTDSKAHRFLERNFTFICGICGFFQKYEILANGYVANHANGVRVTHLYKNRDDDMKENRNIAANSDK